MNWTDEEIDKLFQESASQMNAPAFQDSFWTEMEALLPQKQKKKGLGWIFGGTLTCFALIAAMIFPGNQFSGGNKQTAAAANTAVAPQQHAQTASLASNPAETVAGFTSSEILPAQAPSPKSEKTAFSTSKFNRRTVKSIVPTASDNVSAPMLQATEIPVTNLDPEVATVETPVEENASRLQLLSLQTDAQDLAPTRFGQYSFRTPKNTFYAQAGFGMMQSYIAGSDKNWMPTINVGAGYQYKPQGFGFSAGLNISGSFSNNLAITRRSKIYNFGSTSYEQNLMYKQLYSVELPISLDFRKNRHTVSVGLAPTYLATTVMRFNQFKNEELSENGTYVGQKAGLNSFGLKPSIAYQLEVAKSWNVGIQLNAQVIKQVNETQFVGDLTRIPLSGQITIRKTLTR